MVNFIKGIIFKTLEKKRLKKQFKLDLLTAIIRSAKEVDLSNAILASVPLGAEKLFVEDGEVKLIMRISASQLINILDDIAETESEKKLQSILIKRELEKTEGVNAL